MYGTVYKFTMICTHKQFLHALLDLGLISCIILTRAGLVEFGLVYCVRTIFCFLLYFLVISSEVTLSTAHSH